MATLTTAQKAPVTVGGIDYPSSDPFPTSSDDTVVGISQADGVWFAAGLLVGVAVVTVTRAGRSGSVTVTVNEAPLDVDLGTPIPR